MKPVISCMMLVQVSASYAQDITKVPFAGMI
jgi:hypothetical protein